MVSPAGWVEPRATPAFDEFTVVVPGWLRVETRGVGPRSASRTGDAHAGGRWVRYGTPDGAEYVAVCLPAFSPRDACTGMSERRGASSVEDAGGAQASSSAFSAARLARRAGVDVTASASRAAERQIPARTVVDDRARLPRLATEWRRATDGARLHRLVRCPKEAVFFSGPRPLRGAEAVAAWWKRYYEGPAAPFSWEPEAGRGSRLAGRWP